MTSSGTPLLALIAKYCVPIRKISLIVSSILRVYEQNNIVNSVRVDDWTAELGIIANYHSGREIRFCELLAEAS